MGTLDGRAALVTGGARGIGAAAAARLQREGARLLLTDVDEEALAQAGRDLGAETLAGDLSDPAFAETLVFAARDRLGGLDVIVNNAGFIWPQAIHRMTDEQFDSMIDIHAAAPFRILRAAAGLFRQQAKTDADAGVIRYRKVVNIASTIALSGAPLSTNYAAGKAAVIGLTKALAKEWGRYNVNVNCIAFGMIETRLNDPEVARDPILDIGGRAVNIGTMAANAESLVQMIPMGRAGTAREAADGIYLFCSPDSDYVTGQVLVVGGGLV